MVTYISRRCAQKPKFGNLYELAAKYDWDAEDLQMLREMLRELDITPRYAEELLKR